MKSAQIDIITLDDGRTINRNKAVFLMKPSEKDPNMLIASDRNYKVDEKGTIRRLFPKVKKTKKGR